MLTGVEKLGSIKKAASYELRAKYTM